MKQGFETEILHNPVLGAKAIWHFSNSYREKEWSGTPPNLPQIMLVLPMVFHRKAARSIYGMRFDSGLLKALADAPDILINLPERVQSLSRQSLASLGIASASGLVKRIPDDPFPRFLAKSSFPPSLKSSHVDTDQILKASRRLGYWFAMEDFTTICNLLQVSF